MFKNLLESVIFNIEMSEIQGFSKVELNLDVQQKEGKIVFKGNDKQNLKFTIKQVENSEIGEPQFKIKIKLINNVGEKVKDSRVAPLTSLSESFKWLAIETLGLDAEMIFDLQEK